MSNSFQKFAAFFGILLISLSLGCSQPGSNLAKDHEKAPDFKTAVFYPKNQPPVQLSKLNTVQPVLIVFWATWCPSCREELPKLNKLVSAYQGKIVIISINAQEGSVEVEKFLNKNQIDFPILLDTDGKLSNLFEVTAIPSVLLLAKGGEILYYGFRLPSKGMLEAAALSV